jgi:D-psicose/D-tagatose/L-ribulose 3-epimerase
MAAPASAVMVLRPHEPGPLVPKEGLMHLSMHNWMRQEPIEATLERLASCGYQSIEISGEPTRFDTREVKGHLDRLGLRCWGSVTLMTAGRDLVHEDPYVRYGSVQYLKDCVKMIHELEGEIFCVVPSTVGKVSPLASPEEEWQWAVEGLKEVVAMAEPLGVRVGIEPLNRFETYFVNRHDQALRLARDVGGNCGIVLDAFHINIEEADPLGAIRAAGEHLVDFADNNRFPPGQGSWDWPALIGTLKEIGYDGALTAEFVMPIDRSPVAKHADVEEETEMTVGMDKFIRDHGSGALSDAIYTKMVRENAEFLTPLIEPITVGAAR